MSTFRTPVSSIREINPHPNADKLSIAKVYDFDVVVKKDYYKVGDTVLYIPIDSIIPTWLEERLFPVGSKIKLNKSRVRQIRIRGFASQGMLVDIQDIRDRVQGDLEEGQDLSEILGIVKYEPPVPDFQANGPRVKKERNKSYENPYFHQYGGLENAKWYPDLFQEGQEVVYQIKIHGTNWRASLSPVTPKTIIQKIKKLFGLLPSHEFCYGSNTVQLQAKSKQYTGFYEENVYEKIVRQYDIKNKLKPNETVYGEIFGPGIQKNYHYGVAVGEHRMMVFDVKVLSDDKQSFRWLNIDELQSWCNERGLEMVPVIYRGPHNAELARQYTKGDCLGGQKIREGIVIRDPKETVCFMGKKAIKLISEDYLDKENTDFH